MKCNKCGTGMTVSASDFPGFDLLHCANTACGRPIRLIIRGGPSMPRSKPLEKKDVNRALRAARRHKLSSP